MRLALTLPAVAVLFVLAGCQDQAAAPGPERRSAAGGVLGGEVTDEMLPLDTVRSTAPTALSDPATAGAEGDNEDTPPAVPSATRAAAPSPASSGFDDR